MELVHLQPTFWNQLADVLVVAFVWGTPPLLVMIAIDAIWGRLNPLFFKNCWRVFHSVALGSFAFLLFSVLTSNSTAAWDCFGLLPEAPPETRSRAAFSFLWALAASAFLGWQIFRYAQARRLVASLPKMQNNRVRSLLNRLSPDFSTPGFFDVRVARRSKSPFVFGVFPPTLVLNRGLLRPEKQDILKPALAHELTHLRQHDGIWNLVETVLTTLFFFHPAVWIARGRYQRTVERCADQMAIRQGVKPQELMRATLALLDESTPVAAIALSKEFRSLKDRFESMSMYDRQSLPLWKQGSVVATLVLSSLSPVLYSPAQVMTTVTPGYEVGSCFRSESHTVSLRVKQAGALQN